MTKIERFTKKQCLEKIVTQIESKYSSLNLRNIDF